MGKPHMSRETRTEIKNKLVSGTSYKMLAEHYNISPQTVSNIARELRFEGGAVASARRNDGTIKNSTTEYSVEAGLKASIQAKESFLVILKENLSRLQSEIAEEIEQTKKKIEKETKILNMLQKGEM